MNAPQQQPEKSPPSSNLIDLIDDALCVVNSHLARKLLNLLDEIRRRQALVRENPTDRAAIDSLRSAAHTLHELSSYQMFVAGMDLAFALDSATSRLLVNARLAPAEWERARVMEEHAFALLVPRR